MKKTLVALAALASVSAFAQSSVTIYGALDFGYANTTQDGGATTTNKANVVGGNLYSSRLGFTGVEDLGAGQKSGFTYEVALNATGEGAFSTSTTSGLRTAQVYVSDAKLGTVTAGYGMNARHVQAATLDVTGGANIAGNLMTAVAVGGAGNTGVAGTLTNTDYTARSTSISWTSPTVNGFTGVYGHIFAGNETVTDATAAQATNGNAKADALALFYANGPLTVMGSTTRTTTDATVAVTGTLTCLTTAAGGAVVNATNQATATSCQTGTVAVGGTAAVIPNATVRTNNLLGGIYDLGYAKVTLGMYQDKLQNINWLSSKNDASDVLNRGVQVGVRGPVPGTKAEVFAQLAQGSYTTGGESVELMSQKGRQFGTVYNFSKRTAAYALYGVQEREQVAASATAFTAKRDTVYAVGLRHSF